MYSLLLQNCNPTIHNKPSNKEKYNNTVAKSNGIALIKTIEASSYEYENKRYTMVNIAKADSFL